MSKYVLNPMNTENYIYDLCGVINHLGHSLSMGHYTAFARTHHRLDSTQDEVGWRLFDDSRVVEIKNPSARVVTQDAYVLLYRLRTNPPTDSISMQSSPGPELVAPISPQPTSISPVRETEDEDDDLIDLIIDEKDKDEYFDVDSYESSPGSRNSELGDDESSREKEKNGNSSGSSSSSEEFTSYTNLNEVD